MLKKLSSAATTANNTAEAEQNLKVQELNKATVVAKKNPPREVVGRTEHYVATMRGTNLRISRRPIDVQEECLETMLKFDRQELKSLYKQIGKSEPYKAYRTEWLRKLEQDAGNESLFELLIAYADKEGLLV